jgi:hypothetical protein
MLAFGAWNPWRISCCSHNHRAHRKINERLLDAGHRRVMSQSEP